MRYIVSFLRVLSNRLYCLEGSQYIAVRYTDKGKGLDNDYGKMNGNTDYSALPIGGMLSQL